MRLLHCDDLKLEEFLEDAVPPYAILSHTWGREEVKYQEMLNPTEEVKRRSGYQKILKCAEKSMELGYEYVWIDTCNIDKTSSAELSEAINSMYAWYQKSAICLAYLADIDFDDVFIEPTHFKRPIFKQDVDTAVEKLGRSRWFTRGWTLQELIAPRDLCLIASNWQIIGRKSDVYIMVVLESITSVRYDVLENGLNDTIDIATRMSWASKRQTTRREDIAYCLMGIFDVNMPLLYGEGDKAFQRLQEEIMKQSDDQSIFLWTDPTGDKCCYRGLLARHPSEFAHCEVITRYWPPSDSEEPYAITSTGIRLNTQLLPLSLDRLTQLLPDEDIACGEDDLYLPNLKCKCIGGDATVILKRLQPRKSQFARVCPHKVLRMNPGFPVTSKDNHSEWEQETIYVRRKLRVSLLDASHPEVYGFRFEVPQPYSIVRTASESWAGDSCDILRSYQSFNEGSRFVFVASVVLAKTPTFSLRKEKYYRLWIHLQLPFSDRDNSTGTIQELTSLAAGENFDPPNLTEEELPGERVSLSISDVDLINDRLVITYTIALVWPFSPKGLFWP